MSNMESKINAKADSAKKQREQTLAEAQQAEQTRQAREETKRIRIRRRATFSCILRGIVSVAVCAGLYLAMKAGLVASALVIPCMAIALAWLTFYIGAWTQFYFAKGGFLNVFE